MMILDFRLSFKLLQGKKQIAISHDHHLEFAHKKLESSQEAGNQIS